MPDDGRYMPKVLLVIPEQDDLSLIEGILRDDGFVVNVVADPEQALDFLDNNNMDLLIISHDLPGTRGEGFLAQLRSRDRLRFLPVIVLLNSYDAEDADRLKAAGADEYLLRPLREDGIRLRSRLLAKAGADRRALLRALEEARQVAHKERDLASQSRLFIEEILANISSYVIVIDSAGTVKFINRRAREFFGIPGETLPATLTELLGDDFFAQPETRHVLDLAAQNRERGRLDSLEITGVHGHVAITDMQIAPVIMQNAPHLTIVLDDVTQRWEAEQELLVEKMKLDDVVNAMGASLCLIGKNGEILWHNRTFAEWFGEPRGRRCWQIFRQELQKCDNCLMDQGVQIDAAACREWRIFGPQGRFRAFQNHLTPIRNMSGDAESALVLTQDVTQQAMRLEQLDLLRRLGTTIEANLELDRLLHMILTMVTAGHALGFNRAFLFLLDRDGRTLRGRMALGPTSREEAFHIWAELAGRSQDLQSFLEMVDRPVAPEEIPLSHLVLDLVYDSYSDKSLLVDVVTRGKAVHVTDSWHDQQVSDDIRQRFHAREFVLVPLSSKARALGVLMADNLYNERPITDDDILLLKTFAQQASQGILNAISFERLRETIDELNATRQQLLESERLAAIGKTAAFVAHEIRNPLATIGGWARSILKKSTNRQRVEEAAGIVLEETTRLESMLKDVMDFARPSKPVFTVEQVNPIVATTLNKLARVINSARITVDKKFADNLPRVKVDAAQIEQVLLNLIKNSVEAIGQKQGTVTISTWKDGSDFVAIGVKDTGGGISTDVMGRMFDPFYTTKHRGSGLGLAVSRGIIASHGGRLDVVNKPGTGLEMIIRLPAGEVSP
ncbi:MAG: PAS domain-containing protein [Planctomycetes bacterium]|nr:PAS domain-containing protein [Planctomycetota bacterium]